MAVTTPGKIVADEFYVHLSALPDIRHEAAKQAIQRIANALPCGPNGEPNVAKFNLRTGRLSLLAYADFLDDPFPRLVEAWIFQPGATLPYLHRRYDDSLNPPILHRKELLLGASHPNYGHWEATTKIAESLGLFDDPATIGFRLNWERLIASKGYELRDGELVPIGNDVRTDDANGLASPDLPVQRHLTALSRTALSAPVQLLVRHGLLGPGQSFFDYGCGRGGDVAGLRAQDYEAQGWDPHYAPEVPLKVADVVNLGFVVNVIEDPAERVEALIGAFRLAKAVLAVGVMLYGSNNPGERFRDGYLTSRNTFQKYFSQTEFKDYLEHALHRTAFMVGPGVAFVFPSDEAEQRYCAARYRNRGLVARLLAASVPKARPVEPPKPTRAPRPAKELRTARETRLSPAMQRLALAKPTLDCLWTLCLDLGRIPESDEIPNLVELTERVGSFGRALRLLHEHYDWTILDRAVRARAEDVQLLMATQQFTKRVAYRQLEPRLQRDIKAFFGDYKAAQNAGLQLLRDAAEPAQLLAACKDAAARGLGWLDGEHSLQLHVSMIERLPAILRAYIACGLILWDSLSDVQLVKVHIGSGKLKLLEYDDFDESPLPLLRRRIKVYVRRLDYEVFEYGSSAYPKPVLYRKSRYLHEDCQGYAEQLVFDEALERFGLLSEDHGPPQAQLVEMLEVRRLAVSGLRLVRSQTIPDLDQPCGAHFTYRDLIECGVTQKRLGIANLPLRPESYNALFDLVTELLDPLIDYFGSVHLTYGFASPVLTRHIERGIAPKLDQHAACEHTATGRPVCSRAGAACDFLVKDENMEEVADWIIAHLPFDRLYIYGPERPIHVSYGPECSRRAYKMLPTASGKLVPRPYLLVP